MRVRAADESGFGLIELAFAMVMLNIGILALAATFQSGALAIQRSSSVSNGTAVADKAMEAYRGLQNKAIYLNAPAGGGNDVSGLPNGIPNSTSTWPVPPAVSFTILQVASHRVICLGAVGLS